MSADYVSLRKLADEVGVSMQTVRRWVGEGLKTARLGKTRVTTREWIDEFRKVDRLSQTVPVRSKFLELYGD
jgi:DNA-directed RNA polymerase specialized sigma24 family protein